MSCPICKKTPQARYKPFCSRRCADVDLGKWLNESYRIASEEPGDSKQETESSDISPPNPEQLLH